MKRKTLLYPYFLLIALGVCWGTSFAIARYVLDQGLTPLGYAFWQNLGPALILCILSLIKHKKIFQFQTNSSPILFFILTGGLGLCLPNLIMYYSAAHLPSGLVGLVVNTAPLFTYALSLLFRVEAFSFFRGMGVAVGFFALLLLLKVELHAPLLWLVFSFLTPLCLSACTLLTVTKKPAGHSSLQLAAGMMLFSTLTLIPLVMQQQAFYPLKHMGITEGIIVLEIILSTLGYLMFFELLRVAGPVFYSLVGSIVALSGVVWGAILHGERFGFSAYAGMGLVIASIALVSAFPRPSIIGAPDDTDRNDSAVG